MSEKVTTRAFKIPASLELEMNTKIVTQGYGLRGKSKWICDAICQFLTCPDEKFVLDCIEYSEELVRLDKSITFRPTAQVEQLLNQWIVKSRLRVPTLEGVKSKIIRTAIIHGLLGSVESISQVNKHEHFDVMQNATL